MNEYVNFSKMITPSVVKVLFWIFSVFVVIAGLVSMTQSFWQGLAMVVFGPFIIRIYAEMLLVLFQINNTLSEIKTVLEKK